MAINVGILEAIYRLRDEVTPALARAGIAIEKHGKKMQKVGQQMSAVGSQLTAAVTLPLAALGGLTVKAASDFESSFAGVRKTVNATAAEFSALSTGMRDLSKTIPVNVNELNAIGEAAGQLGIKTGNILEFTKTMAALGVATNLSSQEAATALARFANITQLPQDQIDRLGSTIVALGNNFATTEAEIVSMGLRIAGAGSQIGLTEGQILAFSTALSSVGIEAEAGGSAISKVMIDIALSVSKGGKRLEQFAQISDMTASDFKQAFQEDAGQAVSAFILGLGRMAENGENVLGVLEKMGITEVRMRDALLRASGAGDLLTRALDLQATAWEENSALTKEAEQRYKTFESQMTLLRNEINDVAITFGTALLPVLRDIVTAMEPLLKSIAGIATGFAKLSQPIRVTITVFGLLAAAVGPVLFVTGQLIAAWGTLTAAAPRVVAAITSVKLSIISIGVAVAAAVIAIDYLIGKWGEASEAAARYERRASEALGVAFEIQSAGRRGGGLIDPDLFQRGAKEVGFLRDEIEKTKKRIEELSEAEQSAYRASRRFLITQELEKEQEKLADLTQRFDLLNTNMARVGVSARKTGAAVKDVITPVTGPSVEDQIRALEAALARLDAALRPLQAMRDMLTGLRAELAATELAITAEDLERIALAIALGLDPMDAMTGRLRTYLEYIQRVQKAIRETTQALEDYTREVQGAATGGGVTVPSLSIPIALDISDEFLDELTAEYERHVNEAWTKIHENYLRSLQEAFGKAFTDIFTGGDVDFEKFAKDLGDMGGRILGETLAREMMKAFEGSADWKQLRKSLNDMFKGGVGTFNAATIVAGNIASANSATYAAIGAAVGAIIGAAIAAYFTAGSATGVGAKWGAVIGSWLGSLIKKGSPEFFGALTAEAGKVDITKSDLGRGFETVGRSIGQDIADAMQRLLDTIGATLLDIASGIDLKVKEGKLSVFIDGLEFRFKEDIEAGIAFALTEALKRADISGAADTFIRILENTTANTLEELSDALDFGKWYERLRLGDTAADLQDLFTEFGAAIRRAIEYGLDTGPVTQWLAGQFQTYRNQILGIVETEEERIRRQADSFNQWVQITEAEQLARKADLQVQAATLKAEIDLFNARWALDKESLSLKLTFLELEAEITEAEWGLIAAKIKALEAINQALAIVEGLLANLPDLISDTELDDAIRRAGRGGRGAGPSAADQRKDDQEQLRDLLDDASRALLPEFARRMAEINLKWDEAAKLAHGNAELLAEVNAAREAEIALLREQRWADFTGSVQDFVASAGLPLASALADVDEQARDLMADLGAVAEELGLTGHDLLFFFQQLQGAADDLKGQIIAKGIAGLMGGLADLVADEDMRHQLLLEAARIEFTLRMAQLTAEFELLKALGVLTAEQVALIDGALKYINDNADAVIQGMLPGGAAGGGGGGTAYPDNDWYDRTYGSGAEKQAAALERLRDIQARGLDALTRGIRDVNKEFTELRDVLGNTAEVQAAYAAEIRRVLMEQLEPIRQLQEELAFRSDAPVKTIDQFRMAQTRLNDAMAALKAGDLSQIEKIPDLARLVLDLIPSSGGSESRRFIFKQIRKILEDAEAAAAAAVEDATGISDTTTTGLPQSTVTIAAGQTIGFDPTQEAREVEKIRLLRRVAETGDATLAALYSGAGVRNVA